MTEVQHRNRTVNVPEANLARPLFILGILAGILAIVLFQFAVRNMFVLGYDATEASYVLGLVCIPILFFALVWGYRSFTSAMIFGVLGLLVAGTGIVAFSYYYPNQITAFDTAPDTQTILVMNVYLLGLLLLLVGLYVGNTLRTRRLNDLQQFLRADSEVTVVPVPGPPLAMGQVLPVQRLEGVRRMETRRLREAGIHHTGQLLYRDPAEIGRTTNLDEVRVRAWQSMADLVRIDGIGPGFAATLYRSGIVSVGQLADETPETLTHRIQIAPKTSRSRKVRVDMRRARAWIEEARKLTTQHVTPQANAATMTSAPTATAAAQ